MADVEQPEDDLELVAGQEPIPEPGFAGHDAANGMNHLAIPDLAGAKTIAAATAGGSAKASRQARILGWGLIVCFLVVPAILMLVTALNS
jgi:small neutral amino acid transporter SnatA (MarC family)